MKTIHVISLNDINRGMSIYHYPPNVSMLFHLMGRYNVFHMQGVSFPLLVTLYDRDMKIIKTFIARPGDPPMDILRDAWYMLEIPVAK